MIGRRILHYEILGELGKGGMGVVYKAYDTRLDREVALKVLPPEDSNPERRERFFREAKAASALNHPNIITIYEVITVEGMDVIVMEYVKGETLHRIQKSGRIPVDQVLRYAIQVCEGLAKAHSTSIIHRDLKPGNIMVNEDGLVKILDFGLAKREQQALLSSGSGEAQTVTQSLTAPGEVLGTPSYMSPEQILGKTIDTRSDMFSFGIVLYEMLSGVRPFHQPTAVATVHDIVYSDPKPLRELCPELPEALIGIVNKVLSKAASSRCETMSEVAAHLRAVLTGAALEETQTASYSIAPLRRPPRKPAYAALGVLLAAGIAAGAWLIPWPRVWNSGDRSAGIGTSPSDADALRRQSRVWLNDHYRPGNTDKAISALGKILALEEKNATAHAMLAEAFLRKNGESPDTNWMQMWKEHAQRAAALNPQLAARWVHGAYLLAEGKPESAAPELRQAAELDPLHPVYQIYLGRLEQARKNVAEAENHIRKAVALDPNRWNSHMELGAFLYRQGRPAESAQAFERARDLAPDSPQVHHNLAGAYHHLDRNDEAASSLQRALELRPTAQAYNNLGTFFFFQGKHAASVEAFDKALSLNANSYLYWGNYGDACRWSPADRAKAGDAYARAIELASRKLQVEPADLNLRSTLATYFVKSGRKKEALREAGLVESEKPENPAIRFKLAQVREIVGDRQRALAHLGAALKLGYARREIERDPELVALRRDPAYHRLMASQPDQSRKSR